MPRVSRYHPLLVALHWIMVVLIFAALYFGTMHLANLPNNSPMKIVGLRVHMIVGLLILALVLVRLLVRRVTAHPPRASTGSPLLDMVARVSHPLLYIAVIGMAGMGLALALQAGLFGIVFARRGALPPSLWVYWPRMGHFLFSRLLMFLIALHLCGVFYHMVIRRDGLMRRMWFGARKP